MTDARPDWSAQQGDSTGCLGWRGRGVGSEDLWGVSQQGLESAAEGARP